MAQSRVINTGPSRFIGFLPPHGIFMAAGSHLTLDGDLRTMLASGRGRYTRKTELAALDADIAGGTIHVTDLNDSSQSLT